MFDLVVATVSNVVLTWRHRSSRSCAPGDEGDEVSSLGPRMRIMHAGEFRLVAGSLGPSSKLPEGLCLYREKSALSGSCDLCGLSVRVRLEVTSAWM